MRLITAPERFDPDSFDVVVFLSGSIEMGKAKPWRHNVITALSGFGDNVIVLNPRRDDWDDTWVQEADFEPFREQVEWELFGIERADVMAIHFQAQTYAPITLLELGLVAWDLDKTGVVVYCEPGYWRRGNVEIVAKRYGSAWAKDWDSFISGVVRSTALACVGVDDTWGIHRTTGITRAILEGKL